MRITRSRIPTAASTAPAPAPTPAPVAQTAAPRAAPRFRGGLSLKPDSKSAAREAIHAHLQSIAIAHREIDIQTGNVDIAFESIKKLMQQNGLTHEEAAGYAAEYAEQYGRSSRTVIVDEFRKAVSPEIFEKCIEIPLSKAQQHLGEKEIERVCEFTPAASQGFKLKVAPIKTTVTRSKR